MSRSVSPRIWGTISSLMQTLNALKRKVPMTRHDCCCWCLCCGCIMPNQDTWQRIAYILFKYRIPVYWKRSLQQCVGWLMKAFSWFRMRTSIILMRIQTMVLLGQNVFVSENHEVTKLVSRRREKRMNLEVFRCLVKLSWHLLCQKESQCYFEAPLQDQTKT